MSRPTVLLFPGASLMEITPLSSGVQVRCPGCGAVQRFLLSEMGTAGHVAFTHEDGCAVHSRIQAAIQQYERGVVNYG